MVSFSSHTKGIIAKWVTTSSLPYLQAIEHTYAQIYEQPFTAFPFLFFQTSDVRVVCRYRCGFYAALRPSGRNFGHSGSLAEWPLLRDTDSLLPFFCLVHLIDAAEVDSSGAPVCAFAGDLESCGPRRRWHETSQGRSPNAGGQEASSGIRKCRQR